MSLGRNGLIKCMSASTPGLIPEKMLTDGILMKRQQPLCPLFVKCSLVHEALVHTDIRRAIPS